MDPNQDPSQGAPGFGNAPYFSQTVGGVSMVSRSGLLVIPVTNELQCGICDPTFRDNLLATAGGLYSTALLCFEYSAATGTLATTLENGCFVSELNNHGSLQMFVTGVDQIPTPGNEGQDYRLSYAETNITSDGFPADDEALQSYGLQASICSPIAPVRVAGTGGPPLTGTSGFTVGQWADLGDLGPDNGYYRKRLATMIMDSFSVRVTFDKGSQPTTNELGPLSDSPTAVSRGDAMDNGWGYNTGMLFQRPLTFVQPNNNRRTSSQPQVELVGKYVVPSVAVDPAGTLVEMLTLLQGPQSTIAPINILEFCVPVKLYFQGRLFCAGEICDVTDPLVAAKIAQMDAKMASMDNAMSRILTKIGA